MPVFTLAPQWAAGLKVRQEHRTIIREALDLSEERRRTRPRALFGIDYDALTLSAQETGYHRKVIEQAQAMPVGCPFWPHMVLLTADAASGATELQIEDCNELLFTTLKYALVMDRFDNWEVVTIESVSEDGLTLTLANPTTQDWTAAEDPFTGARLYPLMYGALKRPAFTALNDEESTAKIQFDQKQYDFYQDEGPSPPAFSMTQSPCGELITFSWTPQIADYFIMESSPDGVTWTQMGDVPTDVNEYTMANPFGAGSFWQLTAVGYDGQTATSVPLTATAPHVEPCVIALGGCSLLPDVTVPIVELPNRQVEANPVSVHENSLVAQDNTYLWITDKYDFYIDDNYSGLYTATIDVTCPTPGATICWSTDGSDPTVEGPNDHTLPHEDGFGCIVKARAWLNGCYSAMTVVLIDKRVDVVTAVETSGQGQTTGGACSGANIDYLAVPDGLGGQICQGPNISYPGDSCQTLYGGPGADALETGLRAICCANLTPIVSATRQISYFDSTVTGTDTVDLGSGVPPICASYGHGGTGYSGSVSVFIADKAAILRRSFWDNQPSDISDVRAFALMQDLAAIDIPQVQGFTGPTGDAGNILTPGTMAYYVNSFVRRTCGSATSYYTLAQVILTKDVAL